MGGTSLSAPVWAGLLALVDQGRAAAGESSLNSTSPTEVQQALYSLPQADYNSISSGNNGYSADTGYNLVTGLGTPVANLLVPDLVGYQGPGMSYAGPGVGPLQDATLVDSGTGGGGPIDVFSVFDAIGVTGDRPSGTGSDGRAAVTLGRDRVKSLGEAGQHPVRLESLTYGGAKTPMPVLQAAVVDSVLGTLGDWPSPSSLDRKKSPGRIAADRAGGVA